MAGEIKSSAPNLITTQAMIANNVANIVVPSTANSIFDELAAAQREGGIPDPRSSMMGTSSTALMKEATMTTSIKSLHNQLNTQTRPEMASHTGIALPNLASSAPKKGIATSAQHAFHDCRTHGQFDYGEAVDGGQGASAQKGDTKFVDDKGWPVTLKQILGSRLLSPEMLKAASIQNVNKLIRVSGGTSQQNEELKYMFQRMMLEGFIRGVDITKELKRQGGLNITIGNYETIGVHKSSGYGTSKIIFQRSWWNKKGDADKYTLFLHEVGHSLLNAQHENNRSKKKKDPNRIMTPIYAGSVLRNYNGLMNQFFSESTSTNKIGVKDYGKPASYDASWFPALSGVESGYNPSTPSAPGTTGDGGSTPAGGPDMTNTFMNTTNNSYTIVPPTVEMTESQATVTGPTARAQSAAPTQSIVAPQGLTSDVLTATSTFAAGMADLSKRNSGADMEQAGLLLKSG